jgi:hypothetical protein
MWLVALASSHVESRQGGGTARIPDDLVGTWEGWGAYQGPDQTLWWIELTLTPTGGDVTYKERQCRAELQIQTVQPRLVTLRERLTSSLAPRCGPGGLVALQIDSPASLILSGTPGGMPGRGPLTRRRAGTSADVPPTQVGGFEIRTQVLDRVALTATGGPPRTVGFQPRVLRDTDVLVMACPAVEFDKKTFVDYGRPAGVPAQMAMLRCFEDASDESHLIAAALVQCASGRPPTTATDTSPKDYLAGPPVTVYACVSNHPNPADVRQRLVDADLSVRKARDEVVRKERLAALARENEARAREQAKRDAERIEQLKMYQAGAAAYQKVLASAQARAKADRRLADPTVFGVVLGERWAGVQDANPCIATDWASRAEIPFCAGDRTRPTGQRWTTCVEINRARFDTSWVANPLFVTDRCPVMVGLMPDGTVGMVSATTTRASAPMRVLLRQLLDKYGPQFATRSRGWIGDAGSYETSIFTWTFPNLQATLDEEVEDTSGRSFRGGRFEVVTTAWRNAIQQEEERTRKPAF